jgi:hypothetical protein
MYILNMKTLENDLTRHTIDIYTPFSHTHNALRECQHPTV